MARHISTEHGLRLVPGVSREDCANPGRLTITLQPTRMTSHNFIDRCVYKRFQIDTNRINARQAILELNLLEQWSRDKVIELFISEVAYEEALDGNDPRRRAKTMRHYFSGTAITTPEEQERMREIEQAVFPDGAKTQSERNDVEILFNADKYHAILVTADGGSKTQPRGILGSRDPLAALGIEVVTSEEAVAIVRRSIAARDQRIREGCSLFGVSLPEWIGKD